MTTLIIGDELAEKLRDYKENEEAQKLQRHRLLNATELAEDIECSLTPTRPTLVRIADMLRLFHEVVKSIPEP